VHRVAGILNISKSSLTVIKFSKLRCRRGGDISSNLNEILEEIRELEIKFSRR